jgi:prepilin-type N-terminal cleavage/methylation domain-containing protein
MKANNVGNKSKGFTLVELLVVIAIMAVLMGIGIPAILNAQRASRNAGRQDQLRAVRDAMFEYYSRYSKDPDVFKDSTCAGKPSGTESKVYVGESTKCSRVTEVALPSRDGYTLSKVDSCTGVVFDNANSKNIRFVIDNTAGTITMCKEPSGTEVMPYRQ